jgi:hypothetical protein
MVVKVGKKIQLSNSTINIELANEWGFEVEGYNRAKLKNSKLGFQGFDVKIEIAIEIGLGLVMKLTIYYINSLVCLCVQVLIWFQDLDERTEPRRTDRTRS